jgi:putative hemolysin
MEFVFHGYIMYGPSISILPEIPRMAIIGVIILVLLLGLSAFFSSAEIAMFSLAKHRLDNLVGKEVLNAEIVEKLKDNPQSLLVTLLLGNNISNVAMSSIATSLFALYFTNGMSIAITTFLVTAMVLLFGEIIPKSYAMKNPETWALNIAKTTVFFKVIFGPIVNVFIKIAQIITRESTESGTINNPYVTRDEIQTLLETGKVEGVIEEDELEMLQGVFDLEETIAKEIMTLRLDIDATPINSTIENAVDICIDSGHMCLPVYNDSLDSILGIVTIGNLLTENRKMKKGSSVEMVLEPTLHIPESKKIDELLAEMQKRRLSLVIVVDEYGTTSGLITLEDILEEIVGEILETEEEVPIKFLSPNIIEVRGDVNIDEINSALGIELPEGNEFETIAGFVLYKTGRIVESGEFIMHDGIEIVINKVDKTRILKVTIKVP